MWIIMKLRDAIFYKIQNVNVIKTFPDRSWVDPSSHEWTFFQVEHVLFKKIQNGMWTKIFLVQFCIDWNIRENSFCCSPRVFSKFKVQFSKTSKIKCEQKCSPFDSPSIGIYEKILFFNSTRRKNFLKIW